MPSVLKKRKIQKAKHVRVRKLDDTYKSLFMPAYFSGMRFCLFVVVCFLFFKRLLFCIIKHAGGTVSSLTEPSVMH